MKKAIFLILLMFAALMNVQAQTHKTLVALGDSTYQAKIDSLMALADKEYYYKKGSFSKAFKLYKQAYQYGSAEAAFIIGNYYENGCSYVCKENINEAFRYWEEAAISGHVKSAYKLGNYFIYYTKTQKKGIYWMELADSLGSKEAPMVLGQLYGVGYYLDKDYEKSLKYYTKAADRGVAEAQEYVGLEYFNGKNTKRNILLALKYLKLAGEQGRPVAAYYAALCHDKGWGMPNPDYIGAAYYYMVAADGDIVQAQQRLSELYAEGLGVEKNPTRAEYWKTQAQKNNQAQDNQTPSNKKEKAK